MEEIRCYFDICRGDDFLGRIVFELFPEIAPRAVENFRVLCRPDGHPHPTKDGEVLEFKGTVFHKVIPNFMIQGGDVLHSDGKENATIFGELIEDESYEIKHRRPGLLGLCNNGPGTNTNGSQFYITTVPCPHLDGEHVVFGKVIRGMDVVHQIEKVETWNDQPKVDIRIEACGEIFAGDSDGLDQGEDAVPDFPEDLERKIPPDRFLKLVEQLRQLGNTHFKEGRYHEALRMWHKTARYLEYSPESRIAEHVRQHKIKVYSNIARVSFRLEQWEHVIEACHLVLAINPLNAVALFKRGDAWAKLGDLPGPNSMNKYQFALQDYSQLSNVKQFKQNKELYQRVQEVQKKLKRMQRR